MSQIAQYDYLLATTPAEDSHPWDEGADELLPVAASMVREALRLAALVALSDPVNGGILLGRMAGLSLSEIGQRSHMTKQAVHKRIVAIGRRFPALAGVLTGSPTALDETVACAGVDRTMKETEHIRQEATRWMNRAN